MVQKNHQRIVLWSLMISTRPPDWKVCALLMTLFLLMHKAIPNENATRLIYNWTCTFMTMWREGIQNGVLRLILDLSVRFHTTYYCFVWLGFRPKEVPESNFGILVKLVVYQIRILYNCTCWSCTGSIVWGGISLCLNMRYRKRLWCLKRRFILLRQVG